MIDFSSVVKDQRVFPPVVFPLKDKMYRIRNTVYKNEDLGRIKLLFNEDSCILYLRDNYTGLHPNWLMLMWAKQGRRVITGSDAKYWLSKRICPPGRHNIRDILKNNGLKEYNAAVLIAHNKGICSWDELWFEEIE